MSTRTYRLRKAERERYEEKRLQQYEHECLDCEVEVHRIQLGPGNYTVQVHHEPHCREANQ